MNNDLFCKPAKLGVTEMGRKSQTLRFGNLRNWYNQGI